MNNFLLFLVTDCGQWPHINNSDIASPNHTTFTNTANYSCDPGYRFPDKSLQNTFHCGPNGNWEAVNFWNDTWEFECQC